MYLSVERHDVIEPTLVFEDADVCFVSNSSSEDTLLNDPEEIINSQANWFFFSPEPEIIITKKEQNKLSKRMECLFNSSEASKAYQEEKWISKRLTTLENLS